MVSHNQSNTMFLGSPLYNVSEYLVLTTFLITGRSGNTVRNCMDFISMIRNHKLNNDDVMASFVVVELFPDVPTQLVIEVAQERLGWDPKLEERTPLRVHEAVRLLRLCLNQTHFAFSGETYHQVDDCPIDSHISLMLAKLVMAFNNITPWLRTRTAQDMSMLCGHLRRP